MRMGEGKEEDADEEEEEGQRRWEGGLLQGGVTEFEHVFSDVVMATISQTEVALSEIAHFELSVGHFRSLVCIGYLTLCPHRLLLIPNIEVALTQVRQLPSIQSCPLSL